MVFSKACHWIKPVLQVRQTMHLTLYPAIPKKMKDDFNRGKAAEPVKLAGQYDMESLLSKSIPYLVIF